MTARVSRETKKESPAHCSVPYFDRMQRFGQHILIDCSMVHLEGTTTDESGRDPYPLIVGPHTKPPNPTAKKILPKKKHKKIPPEQILRSINISHTEDQLTLRPPAEFLLSPGRSSRWPLPPGPTPPGRPPIFRQRRKGGAKAGLK